MPELRIDASAAQSLSQLFRQVEQTLGTADPLLKRFGVVILQEIAENFRVGGRPAWSPLAASTQATRRGGKGGQPLVNTGRLRDSFDVRLEPRAVVAFSRNPVASYAEFGTKPHEIRAVRAKALAIPTGPMTKAGLGKARDTGRGSFRTAGGKVRVPHQTKDILFRTRVHHPGTPPRPILPTPDQLVPKLEAVAVDFVEKTLGKTAA